MGVQLGQCGSNRCRYCHQWAWTREYSRYLLNFLLYIILQSQIWYHNRPCSSKENLQMVGHRPRPKCLFINNFLCIGYCPSFSKIVCINVRISKNCEKEPSLYKIYCCYQTFYCCWKFLARTLVYSSVYKRWAIHWVSWELPPIGLIWVWYFTLIGKLQLLKMKD